MVYITHSGENVDKINNIVSIAQKRFGLFGLEKTTMKEIASDLCISKAALYYYFPDKEHLFKAVVEVEQESFFQLAENIMQTTNDPLVMLKEFVKIRLEHFKKFFNLSRLSYDEFKSVRTMLSETFSSFCQRETEVIKLVLDKGIEGGLFKIQKKDSNEVASLFFEMLRGMRTLALHNKDLLYVEQEEFDKLKKKLNAITDIFIRGLMYNPESLQINYES
jgi:AcrR family transcriptional regulator